MLRGTLLKFFSGRLLIKFVDDRFIPSTMEENIHFSSYEYFKNLEEGLNDKGKSDKNENTEYRRFDSKSHALLIKPVPKGYRPSGDPQGTVTVPFKTGTLRTSYPKEDKEYGISCFTVIDPDKDMENGKIKTDFIKDINEISNNRRFLLFQEKDVIESLNNFSETCKKDKVSHNIIADDVKYTDDNSGKRNGFQKDLRYSNQHEWRIKINMDALDDNGNMILPDLDMELVNILEGIEVINQ